MDSTNAMLVILVLSVHARAKRGSTGRTPWVSVPPWLRV